MRVPIACITSTLADARFALGAYVVTSDPCSLPRSRAFRPERPVRSPIQAFDRCHRDSNQGPRPAPDTLEGRASRARRNLNHKL